MAKSVNFPAPARPARDPCSVLAAFFWAGEYEARCILAKGHTWRHYDGITYSIEDSPDKISNEEA